MKKSTIKKLLPLVFVVLFLLPNIVLAGIMMRDDIKFEKFVTPTTECIEFLFWPQGLNPGGSGRVMHPAALRIKNYCNKNLVYGEVVIEPNQDKFYLDHDIPQELGS